jgi:hypothetical protein
MLDRMADEVAAEVSRLRVERDGLVADLAAARQQAATAQALAARTTDERDRIEELEQRLARAEGAVALLTGPNVRTVSLAGQEAAPSAHARAFVDPTGGRLVLYVYDLPPPPPGKTYQLWVILGGTPVSAGTFGVEADGRAHYESQPAASFGGEVTVAVTVEPAGGVPSPTGPMVLVGS